MNNNAVSKKLSYSLSLAVLSFFSVLLVLGASTSAHAAATIVILNNDGPGFGIANNVAGSPPPGLGGADPAVTIPTVSVTLGDANAIKAQLGTGVNVTIKLDNAVRAGAAVKIGCDHSNYPAHVHVSPETLACLAGDLAGDPV